MKDEYSHLNFTDLKILAWSINKFCPYHGTHVTAATVMSFPKKRLQRAIHDAVRHCINHPPGSRKDAVTVQQRKDIESVERKLK